VGKAISPPGKTVSLSGKDRFPIGEDRDANAADLAFLAAERGQFTTSLARVGTLDARQEALKAQLQ